MKIFLATVVLFHVYVALVAGKPHHRDLPPELKAAHENCQKELNLSKEDLFKGKRNGDFEKRDCFKACIAKERGLMTADGNWDKEKVLTSFPPHVTPELAKTVVDTCYQEKGADECETVVIAGKCKKNLLPRSPLPPKVRKAHEECKEELHLTDEDVKKFKSSEEEAGSGCFYACVSKRMGLITSDGVLDKDEIMKNRPRHVSEEIVEKVVKECGDKKGADDCETATVLYKCFREQGFPIGRHEGPPPEM